MKFTPTSNPETIEPFKSKNEVEEYLRKMQEKFIKLKQRYPEESLVFELEDETFVCIVKTQKACQAKIDEIKQEK